MHYFYLYIWSTLVEAYKSVSLTSRGNSQQISKMECTVKSLLFLYIVAISWDKWLEDTDIRELGKTASWVNPFLSVLNDILQ